MKKNNFLKGAAILGVAGLVTKMLGAVYRIPLSNLIKPEGLGYYQVAYSLYMLLLVVSTSGFPTAMAKMISEKRAEKDYLGANRVFKVALMGFLTVGIVSSITVAVFAGKIVKLMKNEGGYYALIALVPALLLVPILSAFRGYFQGKQDMAPIAISQTVEQFVRVGTGLPLAYLLLNKGLPKAAGGASLGGSIGAFVSIVVILLFYFKDKKNRIEEIKLTDSREIESYKKIGKTILFIAIPITIGASIAPMIGLADTTLINSGLEHLGYSIKKTSAYLGLLTGNAQTLINFPQVLSMALAMSLVPVIAEANAVKNKVYMNKTINSGIRVSFLFGLPSSVGLFVLSKPILGLLYRGLSSDEIYTASQLLKTLSLGLIFLILLQTMTAMIQGMGKPFIPVKNLAISLVVKIVLTYILTRNESLNIKGAAIATVITYIVGSVLTYIDLRKLSELDINKGNNLVKTFIVSIIMGGVTFLGYKVIAPILGNSLGTLISVTIGGGVYLIGLLMFKTLSREDLESFPKGERIIKILEKWGKLSDE